MSFGDCLLYLEPGNNLGRVDWRHLIDFGVLRDDNGSILGLDNSQGQDQDVEGGEDELDHRVVRDGREYGVLKWWCGFVASGRGGVRPGGATAITGGCKC